MSRLDDAGMHRTDRNLVQALAFHRQKSVGRPLSGGAMRGPADIAPPKSPDRATALHPAHPPAASRRGYERHVRGGWQAGVARRPKEMFVRTFEARHRDVICSVAAHRHVHGERRAGVAPKPKQRRAAAGHRARKVPPRVGRDDDTRPRAMICRPARPEECRSAAASV